MLIKSVNIEIRKIGNTKSLYEEVDRILGKNDINYQQVSDTDKYLTIAHAIQKMLNVESYFDVTTIRNCSQVANIIIQEERMHVYRTIHCIYWSQMTPEFRTRVIAMVLDDFRTVLNR